MIDPEGSNSKTEVIEIETNSENSDYRYSVRESAGEGV